MPRSTLTMILASSLALGLVAAPLAAGTTPAKAASEAAAALPDSAGAYLAARHAAALHDFAEAARWFDLALTADPKNPELLEGDTASYLALGNLEAATALAERLQDTGAKSQIAAMTLLTAHAQKGDFAAILKDQAAGASLGQLMDGLVGAWAKVGIGKMSEASASFDKVIATRGMEAFGLYHKALALAQTGDYEGAEKLFADPRARPILGLRRGVLAQVEILSQLERGPEAAALIDKIYGASLDDGIADLKRRLLAGAPIPFDVARSAQEGMAEAFFTFATVLADQADDTFTLLNTRVASALRPDHVEAQLMTARILNKLHQFSLAEAAYQKVPAGDPAYISAVVGQAEAAASDNRLGDAVGLLKTLAGSYPKNIGVQAAYGDALRRNGDCKAAVVAYGQALALIDKPSFGDWPILDRRGGCAFELGDWPAAEADYKAALALAPDEPQLLNQLGYGYVDRGENLDAALAMIQKAVQKAPDQGFILDSLAWAYFRLGRYADAVDPQEKASLLMPVDPVVTDHLGDIYWMVGRKREAQYQWHRALSFHPEAKDAARIARKLELGLDQVLQDEKSQGSNGG